MTYEKQDTTSTNSLNSKLGKAIPKPKAKAKRKTKPPTLASRIRILREQGFKAGQIAAMIGCDVQHVYNQNYHDKKQQELKSIKQKNALEKHVEDLRQAQSVVFAGPEPKLSWSERFRILFTGVV